MPRVDPLCFGESRTVIPRPAYSGGGRRASIASLSIEGGGRRAMIQPSPPLQEEGAARQSSRTGAPHDDPLPRLSRRRVPRALLWRAPHDDPPPCLFRRRAPRVDHLALLCRRRAPHDEPPPPLFRRAIALVASRHHCRACRWAFIAHNDT